MSEYIVYPTHSLLKEKNKFIRRLNWLKSGLFLKYQIHVQSTSYQKNIKNKCEDMVIASFHQQLI